MDARFYFVLGSKLIGLYCLVLAVIYFVPVIDSFFSRTEIPYTEISFSNQGPVKV